MRRKLLFTIPLLLAASLAGANTLSHEVAANNLSDRTSASVLPNVQPPDLYKHVWRLIKDDFCSANNKAYNGQDWERWEHKYDGKLETLEDAHVAIATMLASLGDRYTRFLDHDAFDDEKSQIDAKLCGIGVQIGIDKNHRVIVVAPIEGTPAARAGVQSGDEITDIDGVSTKGFSVEDAAKHIRGEANTKVTLVLARGKEKITLPVIRAEISIKAVQTAKMLDGDVGYIRLSSFISQQANQEMKDALNRLSSAKGIIFDLRDNPGGLLTNAIEISNMFLNKGNIVSTVDRDGYKTPAQSDGKPLYQKPLVILINKGSASASEITSGALHDNGRCLLVGQTTFGKGLVQGINKLKDGTGVNITIAKYLTPSDIDINKKGIGPDVPVNLSEKDFKEGKGPWWEDPEGPTVKRAPEDLKDIQLKAALQVLKKKLGVTQSPLAMETPSFKN
jgi:carboxyl-terminal processing protease